MKKALLTVALAGLALSAAAPAYAAPTPGPNQEAYWEAMGYGDCTKEELDDGVGSFVLPAPPMGTAYTLLVLKAGSGATANDVIENPVVGEEYTHGTGKDLSHVIWCVDTPSS